MRISLPICRASWRHVGELSKRCRKPALTTQTGFPALITLLPFGERSFVPDVPIHCTRTPRRQSHCPASPAIVGTYTVTACGPDVPQAWTGNADFELPLAAPGRSPREMPAAEY